MEPKTKQNKKKQKKEQKELLLQQKANLKRKEMETRIQEETQKKQNSKQQLFIVLALLLLIIAIGYLQYQGQKHQKMSKFQLKQQQSLYSILEIDSSATQAQLKVAYKKLALMHHPDKQSQCDQDCMNKFQKVILFYRLQKLGKFWEILSRDRNTMLLVELYHQYNLEQLNIVLNSDEYWIIQVYNPTQPTIPHLHPFFQQMISNYNSYIKFGIINLYKDPSLYSLLPYSFVIYPSVFSYSNGNYRLYVYQERRLQGSLKGWIEAGFQQKITYFNDQEFKSLRNNIRTKQKNAIVLLPAWSKTPLAIRSMSIKFSKFFDMYLPITGQTSRIRLHYKPKYNCIVYDVQKDSFSEQDVELKSQSGVNKLFYGVIKDILIPCYKQNILKYCTVPNQQNGTPLCLFPLKNINQIKIKTSAFPYLLQFNTTLILKNYLQEYLQRQFMGQKFDYFAFSGYKVGFFYLQQIENIQLSQLESQVQLDVIQVVQKQPKVWFQVYMKQVQNMASWKLLVSCICLGVIKQMLIRMKVWPQKIKLRFLIIPIVFIISVVKTYLQL